MCIRTAASRRSIMATSAAGLAFGLANTLPVPAAALADESEKDWRMRLPADAGLDPLALQSILDAAGGLLTLRTVLVVRDGALIAERYYGGAAVDDLQPINSATKSIASMLVGIALQQGKIASLIETIDQLLPAAAAVAPRHSGSCDHARADPDRHVATGVQLPNATA